jgi:hypothetical protein
VQQDEVVAGLARQQRRRRQGLEPRRQRPQLGEPGLRERVDEDRLELVGGHHPRRARLDRRLQRDGRVDRFDGLRAMVMSDVRLCDARDGYVR